MVYITVIFKLFNKHIVQFKIDKICDTGKKIVSTKESLKKSIVQVFCLDNLDIRNSEIVLYYNYATIFL